MITGCLVNTILLLLLVYMLSNVSVTVVVPVTTNCPSRDSPVVTCRCPVMSCYCPVTTLVTEAPVVKPLTESFINTTCHIHNH